MTDSKKININDSKPRASHDEVRKQIEESATVGKRMVAALEEDDPKPFRKSFLRLYACIFIGYLCSATNGFDSNTFGGLSAMTSFTDYFGINPTNQGLVAALYVIGNISVSLVAGPCADIWGRRIGMAIGSAVCLIGAAVQAAGQDLNMLMGGRFALGLGAGIIQSAGPAYVVEMSYPKYRGQLAGGFQACFFLGTIVSTFLEYGLSFYNNIGSAVWRLPLAVQGAPSVLVLVLVWFIPESPRWYVANDRIDEARQILIEYHGDGNPSSRVVALELEEMQQVIRHDGTDKRFWDIGGLFNTRAARHRTFLVTCVAWFAQLDLPPTSYYFPLMGMTICLSIMTACTAHQKGKQVVGGVGIAFLYLFLVVFAFAWTPMQSLYPSEVLAHNDRAKGLAFMNLMLNTANVLNTYVPPIGIQNCSWRFYFMYIAWDVFGVVVIYFTFVETKGWNLEEMDELFHSKSPVKKSLEKKE